MVGVSESTRGEGFTKKLADFVTEAEYEAIPREVVEASKACLLDSLACGLGGFNTNLGKTIIRAVRKLGDTKQSSIIGSSDKISCIGAAFVNTSLINLLDFDDMYAGVGHPGNTVISPALAIGDVKHVSGREFITAVIVGYDVSIRVGLANRPSLERLKDIFPIGNYTLGATAAVSKMLGLDKTQVANAFGLASSGAPIPLSESKLLERPIGWMKSGIGFNSVAGIMGAFLAEEGVTSWQNILEGESGFWKMVGSDRCSFEKLTENLGKEYKITEMSFKPYPCCRYIHSTLDCVRDIIEECNLKIGDIEKIEVASISLVKFMEDYRPRSMIDAQFSLPYMVAISTKREPPGPKWFADSNMCSDKLLDIADRVKISIDPEADKLHDSDKSLIPSTVKILTKQGKTFTKSVERPSSLTITELRNKFINLSYPTLGEEKSNRILRIIEQIEQVEDISSLTEF